jgi:hypothetical protein
MQDLINIFAAQPIFENFFGKPPAFANLADGNDRIHKRQIEIDQPKPAAFRAGALGIRAEKRGAHFIGGGEKLPDRIENAGVSRGVRAARAVHAFLVDRDYFRVFFGQNAIDQTAFARTGDSRHDRQNLLRNLEADVFQIMERRVFDG